MTVEEIEIIVTAKVEEALKEFKKMLPQIKQEMTKVQKEIGQVDFNGLAKQVKASGIDKELSKVKQKIKETFNPADVSGLKMQGIKQEISGVSKEVQKLKGSSEQLGNAYDLQRYKQKMQELKTETQNANKEVSKVGHVKYDTKAIQDFVNNYNKEFDPNEVSFTTAGLDSASNKLNNLSERQQELHKNMELLSEELSNTPKGEQYDSILRKISELNRELQGLPPEVEKVNQHLNTNISTPQISTRLDTQTDVKPNQQSLGLWDTLKAKIQQIKPQVQQVQNMFHNMSINPNTKQLDLVKYKISEIEEKLQNAKEGKIHLNTKDIVKAEAELERLNNQKQKLEGNTDSRGNMFSAIFSSLKRITPQMNNISGIAVKVKNNIKSWGGGIRQGIGQIARYATALFGLQSIYSTLSSCANSWLSSQNSGAKQLSANIEYMKYAMGSALAPVIQYVTNLVYQLMKAIQSVVYALTGVNIFANASAKAYNSMASSAGKTAKSSKEASNSLADFDEIHNIQKDTGSGSGGGSSGGTTAPNMDLSGIDNLDNTLINAIKNGDWYKLGEEIGKKINESLEKIPWDKIQNGAKKVATNIAEFINGFIDGTDWSLIGSTIGNGINTGLIFADTFFKKTNFEKIGKAVATTLNSEIKTQDWKLTGRTIADGINSAIDTAYGFVKNLDWANFGTSIGEGIDEAIQNIEWGKLLDTLWTGFKGLLVSLKNLFFASARGSVVENHTELLVKMLGITLTNKEMEQLKKDFEDKYTRLFINGDWSVLTDSVKTLGKNIVEGIKQGMHEKIRDLKDWVREKFDESIIGAIVNLFQIHSPSKTMYELGQYIIQGMIDGIESLIENVSFNFSKMKDNILKKIEEMKNGIKTKIENIKNNVSNWAGDVKNNISSCWENCCKTVGNNLGTMKGSISTGLSGASTIIRSWKNDIGNAFSTLSSNASRWGKDLAENMANGIKRNTDKVTSAVSNVASKIKSFLHFTEPDVGPLSNFHTYMPDMIDLMVEGIHNNMKKVTDELETLTSRMSYTINTDSISNIPTIQYDTSGLQTQSLQESVLYENIKKALANNNNTGNNETINFENKLVVNGKVFAREIIEDLNSEAVRRGYKPILQH
jgi:phage-related protein